MYNTKANIFGNGQIQIRYYDTPIFEKPEEEKPDYLIDADIRNKIEYNPFDGRMAYEIDDIRKLPKKRINIDEQDITEEEKERKKRRSIHSAVTRAKDKVMSYARSTKWEWFVTLTLSPEKIDRFDYLLVKKRINYFFNNVKKNYAPDMKYIVVPEQHKSGAWHFHALLADVGSCSFVRGKLKNGSEAIAYTKYGKKIPLFTWCNYKLGFSSCTRIMDPRRAANYVVKYMSKTLIASTHAGQRYFASKNLELPVVVKSLIHGSSNEAIYELLVILAENYGVIISENLYTKMIKNDYLNMVVSEFG